MHIQMNKNLDTAENPFNEECYFLIHQDFCISEFKSGIRVFLEKWRKIEKKKQNAPWIVLINSMWEVICECQNKMTKQDFFNTE